MARYQLISSLLLLVIFVAFATAEAPRRLRIKSLRQQFARQEVQPTPYPSAAELKPEQPVLIYGPPPATDVNELPDEEAPAVNSFQPDGEIDPTAEEEQDAEEATTPAIVARLRSSRQRLAKLQLAKIQARPQRQRIARLEELPVDAPVAAAAAPAIATPAALPVPQYYYVGAQQPYVAAYNAGLQQLNW